MTQTNSSFQLRDGSSIEIRAITPGDRAALREGFERLSPESRYRRFFGPMPELSERDLDYLTQVDHHDHEALVAIEAATDAGVGVARYVRTAATVAEPAIVVADDWQGRGVGMALLRTLAGRAQQEGVTRFEAPVLATNAQAIRVLEHLGETTKRRAGREVLLTIELPPTEPVPPRWHALLQAFAAGAVEPARTVLERLWPRRPGSPEDHRYNVIVVGTDGSEHSRLAVQIAGGLALGSGARVEVVGAHRFLSGDQAELADTVTTAAGTLRERGLVVGEHVRRGDPALVLTEVAAELGARLIVVGAGGRAKAARRIMGGVADVVAERSPCNVLIVRPREG